MNSLKEKYGDWALVTGASSGIGKEFAIQLAHQKINLVLIARREDRLKSLATYLINHYKVQVKIVPLDLSMEDFISVINKEIGNIEIGILINNAGFTITKNFIDSDVIFQQELIKVNIQAVTILTHYFGNKMKRNGKGGIINLASAACYLPIPKWSTYAASKAYVLHFTEALWHELKPFNVDILALCPGATKTEFNNSSYQQNGMDAKDVVKTGLEKLSKRPSVIIGYKNKLFIALLKFFSRTTLIKIGSKISS